ILLSHQGYTIDQISSILAVQRNAVADWFKLWKASGLEGLIDKPRGGRPPVLTEDDRVCLQQLVEEHPH
ncbi:helix-turn-helix domain-containing protein, partial [Halovibrio sp. HP20-50]|uniref:helix-turn-helix domain-containing protein n=1 Tax=Halovibrio sp. HP20-59 TaxID=3080275 RepID=UPI00294B1DA2